ncbi:MAG: helix-turn-helix domain-containing protein [Bacteroidia bacterium]
MKDIKLSDHIRHLREKMGYSQEYVAERMKISQQMYSQIEKNPERASLSRLKDLAFSLQVGLVTLLNEDEFFVQQNYNQQGGNTASQMHFHTTEDVYNRLIEKMEKEILFLRSVIEKDKQKKTK